MTTRATTRPSVGARRAGYVVAVIVNAAVLFGVNVWPGWDVLPFLTAETDEVVGAVNATAAVSIAANLIYLVQDPPRLRAAGDLVTTAVGLYAIWRVWAVFPFEVGDAWQLVLRVLLVIGFVGSCIGVVVAATKLVRGSTVHTAG